MNAIYGDLFELGPKGAIVPDLPGFAQLRGGGHWTRDVVFSPDGKRMFVSVGSHSNVSDDEGEKRRADILVFDGDLRGLHDKAADTVVIRT